MRTGVLEGGACGAWIGTWSDWKLVVDGGAGGFFVGDFMHERYDYE